MNRVPRADAGTSSPRPLRVARTHPAPAVSSGGAAPPPIGNLACWCTRRPLGTTSARRRRLRGAGRGPGVRRRRRRRQVFPPRPAPRCRRARSARTARGQGRGARAPSGPCSAVTGSCGQRRLAGLVALLLCCGVLVRPRRQAPPVWPVLLAWHAPPLCGRPSATAADRHPGGGALRAVVTAFAVAVLAALWPPDPPRQGCPSGAGHRPHLWAASRQHLSGGPGRTARRVVARPGQRPPTAPVRFHLHNPPHGDEHTPP